ncbi:hypothetical protein P3L10_019324 [Capsicum annuum]
MLERVLATHPEHIFMEGNKAANLLAKAARNEAAQGSLKILPVSVFILDTIDTDKSGTMYSRKLHVCNLLSNSQALAQQSFDAPPDNFVT